MSDYGCKNNLLFQFKTEQWLTANSIIYFEFKKIFNKIKFII